MKGAFAGLEPLRIPIFRAVWSANFASNFGAMIQTVAASWAMAAITASATLVALVQTASALPIVLFSLGAGALADNYDRRGIMLRSQIFMLVCALVLIGLSVAGLLTPALLLIFTFLLGCGLAFNGPAWQASVGEMVPRSSLANAVTLNSVGFNLARGAGPAVGGIVVAAWGISVAFVINALTFVGLIVVLARWKAPPSEAILPPERIGTAMGAGLRYVAMSPGTRATMVRAFCFGTAMSAMLSLMPLIARDILGGGSDIYGFLLGAFGLGGVAGGAIGSAVRDRFSTEDLIRCYCLTGGCAAASIALADTLWLSLPSLFVAGATWILVLSTLNVTMQFTTPRWVVARALSLHRMSMFGGLALGSATWGLLAQRIDIGPTILISSAAYLLCLAIGFVAPLPEASHFDLDPLRRWQEPEIAVPIAATSGPIEISIIYTIPPENVPAFLRLMAERRRIRRRDGARHWKLLRDLNDEQRWVERYTAPTWTEYVRHNHRRTKSDGAVGDGLRALQQGGKTPRVVRMLERQTGSLPRGVKRGENRGLLAGADE